MFTAEQQALRKRGIGASEVSILADCDGYGRTPFWLYQIKTGAWEDASSEIMEIGSCLEAGVLEYYHRKTGAELAQPGTLFHPDHPRTFATPDALVVEGGVPVRNVQVKCVSGHKAGIFGASGYDVPDHFRVQVEQEMEVTGLAETDLVVLLGGVEVRILRVTRTPGLGADLAALAAQFWTDHMDPGVAPPLDGSDAAAAYLAKLYPPRRVVDRTLDAATLGSADRAALDAAAARYGAATALESYLARSKERDKQILQAACGNFLGLAHAGGTWPWLVTWSPGKGRVSWEKLARAAGVTAADADAARAPGERSFRCAVKAPWSRHDKDDETADAAAAMDAARVLGLRPETHDDDDGDVPEPV